jgi:FkbM family methyltransferase
MAAAKVIATVADYLGMPSSELPVSLKSDGLRIPRVIHRVWPGDDPLPAEYQAFGESWALHHPGWELKLWRPSDLPPLRNQTLFDNATSFAEKSDIARYEVVMRYGGVYVDTDFECLRPLDELLEDVEAFIGSENGTLLTNALFGAVPQHPFLERIIAELPASIAEGPHEQPHLTSGPHFLKRLVEDNPALANGLRVFEPDVFYPYLYNEKYRKGEEFPGSYAVHHWGGSWLPAAPRDVPPRYRVIVATEWAHPAAAAAIIRPFAQLFNSEDPVELVLTLPHEPTEADLNNARKLLGALSVNTDDCAHLSLESFDETRHAPYDVAVVSAGDAGQVILEVGEAVGTLHRLRAIVDHHGRPPMAIARGQAALAGDIQALRRRLDGFRPSTPIPSTPPSPVSAGHRATYVGNDRLLVSTTWGGKLFMSASDLSLTPEVVHDGNYDEGFTRFLARTLRPGDVAFDIGANVGLFTLLMARLVGASGHVVAYEAAPHNVELLRDNVAMNYYTGWVDVVPKAAAASEGTLQFYATTRFRGNGSTIPHDDGYAQEFWVDGQQTLSVPSECLDVHLGRFDKINFVKIDVEGGEEQVFAGMESLLSTGSIERVCFELLRSRMAGDWEPMIERLWRLSAAGWTTSVIHPNGNRVLVDVETLVRGGSFQQVLLERPGLSS